jgi:hypothetical protein
MFKFLPGIGILCFDRNTVELGYNVMKGTKYSCCYKRVSLRPSGIMSRLTVTN